MPTRNTGRASGFDHQYGAADRRTRLFHARASTTSSTGIATTGKVIEKGYTTTLLGNDAVKLIEQQDGKKPFYLYLTFNAPHTPYQAPENYLAMYRTSRIRAAAPMRLRSRAMDDQIGRVVAALKKRGPARQHADRLPERQRRNDQRPMFAGELDMNGVRIPCDNGPYRDGEGSLYEGGTRVVALANPGRIKPGTTDEMMHVVDMYPTLTKLAGASTQKAKPRDGMDMGRRCPKQRRRPHGNRLQYRALSRRRPSGRLETDLAHDAALRGRTLQPQGRRFRKDQCRGGQSGQGGRAAEARQRTGRDGQRNPFS